jgi:hypothetical protein
VTSVKLLRARPEPASAAARFAEAEQRRTATLSIRLKFLLCFARRGVKSPLMAIEGGLSAVRVFPHISIHGNLAHHSHTECWQEPKFDCRLTSDSRRLSFRTAAGSFTVDNSPS